MRQRGQLLGWRWAAQSLHPDWQFGARRRETQPGLATALAALREVTPDAEAVDALTRAACDDLGGRSLTDLFAAGRVETVVRLIASTAEKS